ncbi:MAG: hypothetical protein ABSG86_25420 [Thermoguttaceae bacterium]
MALFNISASEAVLIGCCIGEYLEARQDNEYANVLHFFWKWLSPFVPNFEISTTTPIPQDELPLDLEWTEIDGDRECAMDAGDPRVYYVRTATKITRMQWDRQKSSLLDLLGDLVDQFVVKSLQDRLHFPTVADRSEACLHQERTAAFWKSLEEWHVDGLPLESVNTLFEVEVFLASSMSTPGRPDNMEAVIAAVKRLTSENDAEGYFSVGQLFGRTSATLERWERSLYIDSYAEFHPYAAFHQHAMFLPGAEYRNNERLWNYRGSDQTLTAEYHSNVKTLLGARLVQECWHAVGILGAEATRSLVPRHVDPTTEVVTDGRREMLDLAEARKAIWFALGVLLGTLRDVDDAARERDRRSLTPRPYLLSSRASPEQIAGLIRMVEQTFCDPGDKSLQPEYLVNCLANAIEALAKELWPKEFDLGSRKGELRNVLQAHYATGGEAERRFARIALTLYDLYRKPVTHDLAAFKCTCDEARFFYDGIRTLHTLSQEIAQSRSRGQA